MHTDSGPNSLKSVSAIAATRAMQQLRSATTSSRPPDLQLSPLSPISPQPPLSPTMLLESVKAQAAAFQEEENGEGPAFRFENLGLTDIPIELIEALAPYNPSKLSFQNNKILSLPEELGTLDSLYYLDISNNRLTELPPVILSLSQLEILDVSFNRLQRLPSGLSKLSQLQVISLKSNCIEYTPPVLADLTNLTFVELDSNPLIMPPEETEQKNDPDWLAEYIERNRATIEAKLATTYPSLAPRTAFDGRKRMGFVMGDEKTSVAATTASQLTQGPPQGLPQGLQVAGVSLPVSTPHSPKSPVLQPSPIQPQSCHQPDVVAERLLFALRQFLKGIDGLGRPINAQPIYTQATTRVSELAFAIESGVKYAPQCSRAVEVVLELLKLVQSTCSTICAQSDVCAVRALILNVFHAFNELNNGWNALITAQIEHVANTDFAAADELLYNQLDTATNSSQAVLSLLNETVGRSALASTDPSNNSASNEMFATRVRDLSNACIIGFTATRKVRLAMDKRTINGITDRRRFWDDVNSFLKSIIAILAAAKSAITDLPLLAEVRPQISTLAKVAKEIPPLLEQSSYKLSMIENASPRQGQPPPQAPQIRIPILGPLSPSIQPPTPLTASLGQAAQALVSPSIHQQTPFFQDARSHDN